MTKQTPLSHVNLRAVQDGVPNEFIKGATEAPAISALLGEYVRYQDFFSPFVLAALGLLALETVLAGTWLRSLP